MLIPERGEVRKKLFDEGYGYRNICERGSEQYAISQNLNPGVVFWYNNVKVFVKFNFNFILEYSSLHINPRKPRDSGITAGRVAAPSSRSLRPLTPGISGGWTTTGVHHSRSLRGVASLEFNPFGSYHPSQGGGLLWGGAPPPSGVKG